MRDGEGELECELLECWRWRSRRMRFFYRRVVEVCESCVDVSRKTEFACADFLHCACHSLSISLVDMKLQNLQHMCILVSHLAMKASGPCMDR